jgi:hypothetical protein
VSKFTARAKVEVWELFKKAEPSLTVAVNVEKNGLEKKVESMSQEMVKQQLFIQKLMEDGLKLQRARRA